MRRLAKARRYAHEIGGVPVTKREDAYIRLRNRLDFGDAAYRYAASVRPVWGGVSVEDDWPREPYLLVRFTKDGARHLAALKRLVRLPDNLRVKRVRFSERELDRLRDRVGADGRKLAKAGFHIQITRYDTDRGVAIIELVTRRTDTRAFFRKRYGPRVKVVVRGTETSVLECAPTRSFAIAPDGLSITLRYESGGGAEYERTDVVEHPDRVEIGIVERAPTGFRTADLIIRNAPPTVLSAPLGARAVIVSRTGRRLLQRGPGPGEPPCPEPKRPIPADDGFAFADEPRVDAYITDHFADFGGRTVVGTGRKAYKQFGFVKDVARHERAIKRLTRHKDRVRVTQVQYRLSELTQLADRIRADTAAGDGFLDGYGRAAFGVWHVDVGWQSVRAGLYTARSDHAAYFAARYGPAVHTQVLGDRYECAAVTE